MTDKTVEKTPSAKELKAANDARFNESLAALNAELRQRVAGDKETGALAVTPGDNMFMTHVPAMAGLTEDQFRAARKAEHAFVNAVVSVAADKTVEIIKDNKSITSTVLEVPMLNSREKVQVLASTESGLSVGVITQIDNPKVGELRETFKKFDEEIAAIFADSNKD